MSGSRQWPRRLPSGNGLRLRVRERTEAHSREQFAEGNGRCSLTQLSQSLCSLGLTCGASARSRGGSLSVST